MNGDSLQVSQERDDEQIRENLQVSHRKVLSGQDATVIESNSELFLKVIKIITIRKYYHGNMCLLKNITIFNQKISVLIIINKH